MQESSDFKILLRRAVLVLDVGQELPHAVVGHDLEDPKLRLLARIEERIDITQELFLTGLEVRVGGVEVADGAFQVLIRGAALHGLPQLIQRACAALADIESVLHELLQEGKDLRKYFGTDFGLLLELAHVKIKDRILQDAARNRIRCAFRGVRALLPRPWKRKASSEHHQQQHRENSFHH